MDFLKSGFKTVLGAQPGGNQQVGAETVERLVDRVQTSTLLDDRRDACRALKNLSKTYRLEVGAQGMDSLIHIVETDRSDYEIVSYALETLTHVIAGSQDDEDSGNDLSPESDNLSLQFTDIYIKKPDNVALLLDLLEENDFKVRWPTVRLITGLLISRPKELQEIILVVPQGVSRLMDLLSDSREVIRNEVLLLLGHLTKANSNIQKIVAFENAFDKIFDIIMEEGYSDGGVVVEDCLLVLLNLLKNNISNQNFFKEGSYIQKLTPFFELLNDPNSEDKGWSAQKVSNIHLMLQVVRTLVSPNNPAQVISSCQKVMNNCGLLEQLCNILMASGVPADILTEDINTVAEVIRGHHLNQEYFASVNAPSNPPSSAIVALLMSMVNEKQPFVLRCAVLYCFQCFLFRNELGQAQIIQTLLPTSTNISQATAGQLLCGGLFSADSLSNWFAAVALSHSLVDSSTHKEQLLRVQLATGVGNLPIPLMTQCTTMLQQGGKVQTRLGLLLLLCTWLSNCTLAVSHFLSIPTNVPYLTSQVGLAEGDENEDLVQGVCALALGICIESNDNSVETFSKDNLCQLIVKRIGLEMFHDKLSTVTKHERYSQAAQRPQPNYRQPSDVLFDFEFCRLFKSLEGVVIKAVQPKPKGLSNGTEANMTAEQHKELQYYKDMIRDQDQELQELRRKFTDLSKENEKSLSQLTETMSTVQQLRDQNALLKAQRASNAVVGSNSTPNDSEEIDTLRRELEDVKQAKELLEKQLKEKPVAKIIEGTSSTDDNSLEEEQRKRIEEQDMELQLLRQHVFSMERDVERLKDVETNYERLEKDKLLLEAKTKDLEISLNSIRREQDDLLVLLTDNDTRITIYRERIKNLGGELDDDDEVEDGDSVSENSD